MQSLMIRVLSLFSAFLLFQVELMAGKKLLPVYGGGAAVWTACLVFFQIVLLLGYGYAYWLLRRGGSVQKTIHVGLLFCGIIMVAATMVGAGGLLSAPSLLTPDCAHSPVMAILWTLTLSMGLPFFILSTSTSLLQSWWAARQDAATVNTYKLYSYSNTGSLLGLVSYPFLVEPYITIPIQLMGWSTAFILFLLMFLWITLRSATPALQQKGAVETGASARFPAGFSGQFLAWVGLAAIPALLMLAVTTQLTVNVAPIPLLWMLPLAIYLISFMICFSGVWRQQDDLLGVVVLLAVISCAMARLYEVQLGVAGQTLIFSFGLLVVSVFCHGKIYASRPQAGQIGGFYFAVALGGVVGGMISGIVAPLSFKDYWELPAGFALVMLLVLAIWMRSQSKWLQSWRLPLAVLAGVALILLRQSASSGSNSVLKLEVEDRSTVLFKPEVLARQRNFYGVLQLWRQKVGDGGTVYSLLHGAICHGYQYEHPALRRRPTAYYAETGGLGIVLQAMQREVAVRAGKPGLRVAGLGMGLGTIAAYGREGDVYRFYEINPSVIQLATNGVPFTFIRDSEARVEIVEGDARLGLRRDHSRIGGVKFDLIVLDTFSGDSIPVHFLTREAMRLYLDCLNDGGVVAAHISNRFLDLAPVFSALKREFDLEGTMIVTHGDNKISADAAWVILTRNKLLLSDPKVMAVSRPEMVTCKSIRLWTDDYSNLLDVLNWGSKVYTVNQP